MKPATPDHVPVLFDEVLSGLAIVTDGVYVDCTFGRGGHARAILSRLADGRVLALDRDPEAAAAATAITDGRFEMVRAPFSQLERVVDERGLMGKVNGILFDLGVSSPQLEAPQRGFSLLRDGPLDMRMDPGAGASAAQWITQASETEIADCLYQYGEERHSRRIARAIVNARRREPIATTAQLAAIVAAAQPGRERGQHPATRVFQAVRICINDELGELVAGLKQALAALISGGRLLVISFHSLEDRVVKRFMRRAAGLGESGGEPRQLRIVGKPQRPGDTEVRNNPRGRSAILRVAEKLA